MAKNITWRNVENTVTGNPAAALSGAVSAFASAGQGAARMYEQAIGRQEKEQADLTNAAMASIFADGTATPEELAGVDPGADFSKVLSQYQSGRTTDSGLARDKAAIARDEEALRVSGIENSEEALKAKQELESTRAKTAAQEASTSALRAKIVAEDYQRTAAEEAELEKIDTSWDSALKEAYAPIQKQAAEKIASISALPESEMPFAQKQLKIAEVNEQFSRSLEETKRNSALAFVSLYGVENPGYSSAVASRARPFQIQDALSKEQRERDDKRLDAQLKREDKFESDLSDVLAGGKTKANSIGRGAGGEPVILSPEEARANTITAAGAVKAIKTMAGDKWFVDDKLASKYEEHIKDIVSAVGGNKQMFMKEMKDAGVDYNRDTGFLWWGGEDDIKNLPSVVDVEERYNTVIKDLNNSYKGKEPDKVESATQALFSK